MRRLSRAALGRNTAASDLGLLGFDGLVDVIRAATAPHRPSAETSVDPREGFPIVYSEVRRQRMELDDEVCVVCDEQTCPAVDVTGLPGDDVAFLTPNLYPIAYPFEEAADASGVHLVHWSSLRHDGGLCGADEPTARALIEQLARAEAFLLHHAPDAWEASGDGHRGHVGIIKNRGRRVGGSVEHDHQQIMLTRRAPAEPPRTVGLGPHLLRAATTELVVDRVGDLATTLVPAFMRRPLHAFIIPRSDGCGWLHHMPDEERDAIAVAVARLTAAASSVMEERFGEPAWNLVCHTGEGCGPLFELRPFTQPLGGYEHLGIYLCEERPETSAGQLRDALKAVAR